MHVHIVDDDPLIRRMVGRMLASEGVSFQEFGSAALFLDALGGLPFGCVLLDVRLPDRNGLDVLSTVLDHQPFPVVMASGSSDIDDAITSFRRGAVHFLRKPFDRHTLLATLKEAEAIGVEQRALAERREKASRIRLTTREQQVLEAMTQGEQSKAIAWQLGLSVRTVDMHRSNILAKLQAKNGTQAVAVARALRLLPEQAELSLH